LSASETAESPSDFKLFFDRSNWDNDQLAYKGRVDLIRHQVILRDCLYLNERRDHDGIQVVEAFV
jgi:hypothetical protein